jgi:hypothetical protein
MALSKDLLKDLYHEQKMSMSEIAKHLRCSTNKVVYWMNKHEIARRDIREAIYQWHNPDGDPFQIKPLKTEEDRQLFHLALGLYIGEGRKRGHDVSLSNTDPNVIRVFLKFLREICGVNETRLWAWINIFDDQDLAKAQRYWQDAARLPKSQFYKTIIRPHRGGNYSNISTHGTLTVGLTNRNLREIILRWCAEYLSRHS